VAPASPRALQAVRDAALRTLGLRAAADLEFAAPSAPPIRGTGVFDFARGIGTARVDQAAGTEAMVFEPTILFDRPPPAAGAGLPAGKTWIAAEPSEHLSNPAADAQFLLQSEGKNPAFLLEQVARGTTSAAPLRARVIGGSPTSGYLALIDLDQAAASASGPQASSIASTIDDERNGLGTSSVSRVGGPTIRVWVDRSGRVVRLQASPPGSGVGVTTMTFTSFGVRVDARRPPKSASVDVATLLPGTGDVDRD
jgi:hypothetical protein